ncbi:MAG: flap endonuclease-1 [Candidatus Micrarchaeia archaeon]|jgi:flap endonuclease-1
MGIQLKDLMLKKEIDLNYLEGKTVAVDAYNIIYQFLSSIRQYDGTPLMDSNDNITSHLSGLFYRNINFLEGGIKPIYVFDGKPPNFKTTTLDERKERKISAKEKMDTALKKGFFEDAKKYSQQTSRLTKEMVEEGKELLEAMGIPVVQAPSEGEAQASCMAKEGIAYGVVSQDADCLLFGAPRLIRNLSVTGKRKIPGKNIYASISPEIIELKEMLDSLQINREQLILIGILIGTDFNNGIKGVGSKTALKIVKENDDLDKIIALVEKKYDYVFEENPYKIQEFFLNPPLTKEYEIKFKSPDKEKIFKILNEKHDFEETRIENALARLSKNIETKVKQKGLFEF